MHPAGSKVVLISFNGARSAPENCRRAENYWLLIGTRGTIASPVNANGRVLVTFDTPVSEVGLACHNPTPNSLYILETDLGHFP